ncbi:MAG: alpha/beta hydrolase [Polyangiaceae bacterium]
MSVIQRNHVNFSGRGSQPMMFAHGFGCDQNMWRFVTPAFENDYRIVLFDYVGAGKSDISAYNRTKYGSLDAYAQDVLDICDELRLRDVIFVGHSVSSMIGVLAAIRKPELFAALVLIGPSPRYIDDGDYVGGFSEKDIHQLIDSLDDNYLGWSRSMAPVIMGNPERPELGEELTNSFCRTDPEIQKQFARVTFLSDNRDDLPKLSVPSLILQCSVDVIAPPAVGEYVHRKLRDSRLALLDATGHCPNLSAPAEVVGATKRFLAELPATRRLA